MVNLFRMCRVGNNYFKAVDVDYVVKLFSTQYLLTYILCRTFLLPVTLKFKSIYHSVFECFY